MIAYVKGNLDTKTNTFVVIDVQGIGYRVFMPVKSIESLGEIGQEVKVYTHHYVREANISLYGFYSQEELRIFELLISVSGIGAKSANAILANISPSKFALCVISNDVKELTKLPGIGAKSAQRIILELKDRLKTETAISKEQIQVSASIDNNNAQEAISALQVLGYNIKDIKQVISKIENINELSIEDIIKKALAYLGR